MERRIDLDSFDGRSTTTARKVCMFLLIGFILFLVSYSTMNASTGLSSPTEVPDCNTSNKLQTYKDGIYPFAIISDMDQRSKELGDPTQWKSILKKGTLKRDGETGKYSIEWLSENTIRSMHSYKGRGMELSELITFNGKLLAFDDTTGIVYEITKGDPVPWVILADGDGTDSNKGYKTEWATVKGNYLYVGSIGKEWTDAKSGQILSKNPQWVKVIDKNGHVMSLDWSGYYNKIRTVSGTSNPGYIVHESGNWHDRLKKWIFLPRRMSTEEYNDKEDEHRAANKMVIASENFETVVIKDNIGPFSAIRGFSSFKFIPGFDTEFIALKTEEDGDQISSYITVLNMNGEVLMPEQFIDNVKFEGLEIL
eukprot:c8513_g1_i1.p1 GENE.c8513_g1_i1~~c8513_g1_i1.p1  ORF type:complete len:375 (+),score=126.99 c8513_g1_i1:26-1126(+)